MTRRCKREDSMDVEVPKSSAALAPSRLPSVNSYLRNHLPYDLHPSYQEISQQAIRNSRPALPTSLHTDPIPTSLCLTTIQNNDSREVSTFSTEEVYSKANNESLRFQCLLRDYEKTSGIRHRTSINIDESHSWEQVLAQVDYAASAYKDKSSLWSKVRRGMKKFGENHEAFNAWLNLLPTQSQYCSIICGGLKLVINAAARFKEVRESVFEALAEIPAQLNNTKLIVEVFKKSKELHQCSSELYISTLAALQHIVIWFQERARKKFSKAFFKQDNYERVLIAKIAAIKSASKRFSDVATTCSYQKQDEIQGGIRQIKSEVQLNRLAIERSHDEASQNFGRLGDTIRSEHKEAKQDVESKLAVLQGQNLELLRSNFEITSQLKDLMKRFLSSNERINPKTGNWQRQQIDNALDALDYDSSIPSTDISSLLRTAWTFTKAGQDRAVALMQDLNLHAWIKSYVSTILFVNGNFNPSARCSPLSFVCAKLIDSIQPSSSSLGSGAQPTWIIAHSFFCGQHLASKDPKAGVARLIRSLIAQTLANPSTEFALSTINEIPQASLSDVKVLSAIYHAIIMQIPARTTVFCVIDALTFHEDNKVRCRDALTLVKTLADLTEFCIGDEHCTFKVLLTCPGISRALYKELAKADVIWMPKNVSSRGGFTSMKWNASAGKDLGELGRPGSR